MIITIYLILKKGEIKMINIDNEIKKTKEELEELHKRLKKLNDLKMVRESLKSLSREELEERVILNH